MAMAEQDRTGKYFEPSSMTFAAFLQEWLEKYARHYLKPNTIDAYDAAIRNHIAPVFGAWKLRELTTAAFQDWVLELKEQYSKSTVKSIMSCLRSSLRWPSPTVTIYSPTPWTTSSCRRTERPRKAGSLYARSHPGYF